MKLGHSQVLDFPRVRVRVRNLTLTLGLKNPSLGTALIPVCLSICRSDCLSVFRSDGYICMKCWEFTAHRLG